MSNGFYISPDSAVRAKARYNLSEMHRLKRQSYHKYLPINTHSARLPIITFSACNFPLQFTVTSYSSNIIETIHGRKAHRTGAYSHASQRKRKRKCGSPAPLQMPEANKRLFLVLTFQGPMEEERT